MSAETLSKVRTIIVNTLDVAEDAVTPEALLLDHLGADSLAMAELLMAIEEEFGIANIPDEDARNIRSVQDIVDYIDSHCAA
jgi:acyl carrier protein